MCVAGVCPGQVSTCTDRAEGSFLGWAVQAVVAKGYVAVALRNRIKG